ncbi:hypothetical protein [Flavobacterium sp. '19STA2R22 D10 B1']|uniref:hypothetical protein n=1 Tax=Flavobacterium aerium TaxID=3037261 RepID=UPI00278C636A|nr:hypothetical protein [Flavobacterium sp. '19STA2R22 D10 B1']
MILAIQKLGDLFLKSLQHILPVLDDDSIDDILDSRDTDDFSKKWMNAYNETKSMTPKQDKEDLELIDTFRKEIFLYTFSKTNSSDLSSYISDDFDLIASHLLNLDNNQWVSALWANYLDHKIPEGHLVFTGKTIKELILKN